QLHVDSIRRSTVTLKPIRPIWRTLLGRGARNAITHSAPEVGGYGLEGNACGDMAVVRPADRRKPPVRRGAYPRARAAGGRRARLSLAVVVQRFILLRPRRGDTHAEHDAALGVPPLPVAAFAGPQLFSRDRVPAPDGAAGRRDDLRAGAAPVRRSRLDRRPRHAAGALRRVRDPARAPGHGGHALPVPRDGRGHRRAVVAAPVVAGLPRRRPAARGRRAGP